MLNCYMIGTINQNTLKTLATQGMKAQISFRFLSDPMPISFFVEKT